MSKEKIKWDPLAAILESNNKAPISVKDYLSSAKNNESILFINTDQIIRWEHKDRPENELGDIEELANTFKKVEQQQPCILRRSKKYPDKYELIIGERRWKAAELAKIPLKCIVKDIDDKTAVLIQAIENDKRKDISEYSKGMSYAQKIAAGLITQKELIEELNMSKQQISRLLSYSNIPEILSLEIADFRKVSARTAEELVRLSRKSDEHLKILIGFAKKIRDGKYGANKIRQELERILDSDSNYGSKKQITDNEGNHLFTWNIKSGLPEIYFSKEMLDIMNDRNLDFDKLIDDIKESIMKNLK